MLKVKIWIKTRLKFKLIDRLKYIQEEGELKVKLKIVIRSLNYHRYNYYKKVIP